MGDIAKRQWAKNKRKRSIWRRNLIWLRRFLVNIMKHAIKISGDWVLDVLAIPFNRLDSDNQFFDADTDLMPDVFPFPAVVYYHGINPDGKSLQGDPELIGKAVSKEIKPDGVWVKVVLDKTKKYAKRVWRAANKGLAAASSGSIAHLARLDGGKPYSKNVAGRISKWAFAELSLMDVDKGRRPANMYAVALPVLKAVYKQAGIALPESIDGMQEPQVEGDSAARGITNAVKIKSLRHRAVSLLLEE